MRLVPAANAHIQKYPPATLDAGTLRILRDECTGWLDSHHKITAEIEEAIAVGKTEAHILSYWNETFNDDVVESEATLATVVAELTSRGLS